MSVSVKQRQNLEMIAARMLDSVQHGKRPWAYEALPHGLELLLTRRAGGFRLAIARTVPARPSDTEESVIRKAFKVPEWAESERIQTYKNDVHRNVIAITWDERGE